MNKKVQIKTFNGKKYAIMGTTCHTDNGPMSNGYWNIYDDLAHDTQKVGRKSFNKVAKELEPELGENRGFLFIPTSCVKDESFAKRHPEIFYGDIDHCYKVEAIAVIISQEFHKELQERAGINSPLDWNDTTRWNYWSIFAKFLKEAEGREIETFPAMWNAYCKEQLDDWDKRWKREVLGR